MCCFCGVIAVSSHDGCSGDTTLISQLDLDCSPRSDIGICEETGGEEVDCELSQMALKRFWIRVVDSK